MARSGPGIGGSGWKGASHDLRMETVRRWGIMVPVGSRARLIIVFAPLVAQLIACSSQLAGGPPEQTSPPPTISRSVRVVHPEPASEDESYPSSLYAEKDVLVTARRSGVIERVLVDRGRRVRAGQPLAVLETDIASLELEMAEQDLRLAKENYDRQHSLHGQGVISEQEFLRVRIARDQALSGVALAKGQLERCTVRAPFGGAIVERWAIIGQRVQEESGTPLFRVVASEPPRARVDVPEERLEGIFVGSNARIRAEADGGNAFAARVVFVSPAVDPASGTAAVIVETEPAGGALRLGASVRVRFGDSGAKSVSSLYLPREALPPGPVWKGREMTVLVVSRGLAEARRVRVVETRGGSILVKGDLEPDDQVIVGVGAGLDVGDPVVVLEGTS